MTTQWTAERVEILAKLFLDGVPVREIAAAMHTTRNTILAKLSRMGLKREIVKAKKVKPTRPARPKRPATAPILPAIKPAKVIKAPNCRPVRFLALRRKHCRAIIDKRDSAGGFLCCGAPKAVGSSWCAYHHGLYTQPLTERDHHGQAGRRHQPV